METHIEFKRKIDNARNILVGAVPSPAGQIDQITYALIYKFMSDIDDKSARLPGGNRQYFVGEFEKYDWHNLMRLDGQDKLNRYRDALSKMRENQHLPEIFRSIYQNAFLPFNDPRTLNLFLKEIDGFVHARSDAIGDAYEYLLSITGAQGDVGQFRTPRHIIEFIVDVVQPGKNDSVLDPACGTAGFLIAAYNYVRRQHDGFDDDGSQNGEQRLTADERKKLHGNYYGYDIDPTMVRTATVNMYLHGFPSPNIEIHDTLTSEEHWANRYDVILANPPFMTPKGGIQPHGKFGVKATRAEVLFVDYIASHLKPNGRAGIIVPEGIIFQSGTAYKELRKNLIENSLYAVVSLPGGVFNPYAGVKTSILLLDKELAAKKDEILFVKIENDGYSLNAQRREVTGSQLPEALEVIEKFKAGQELQSEFAHTVSRKEIMESGDYNLSGDRYKAIDSSESFDYQTHPIEDLVSTISATVKIKTADLLESGALPVIDQSQKYVAGYTNNIGAKIGDVPIIAFGDHTKAVKYIDFPFAQGADGIKILKPKDNTIITSEFLYYVMSNMTMPNKGYSRHWSDVKRIKIPLPPIEIQREIVTELDGYQKIIDAAQTIIQSYRPSIKIDPQWKTVRLPEAADINKSSAEPQKMFGSGYFTYIDVSSVENNATGKIDPSNIIRTKDAPSRARRILNVGDTLLSTVRPNLKAFAYVRTLPERALASTGFAVLTPKNDKITPEYLYYSVILDSYVSQLEAKMGKGSYPSVNTNDLNHSTISLPPLEIQREIVAELEAEQQLIDANKKLIEIYQAKIKSKIAEIWGG